MFRDASEHLGADFNAAMERPNVVGKFGVTMPELDVGAALGNGMPANSEECLVDSPGLRAGPAAHAGAQVRLIDSGTVADFSTRSAITRRARA
jgi:hypothetical protein